MARILIIPGLSVRGYVKSSAHALMADGHRVSLLAAPTWRQAEADLGDYGRLLASNLEERREDVDLIVALSVGTQAAAVAGANTDRIRRLLLISPTVDPSLRSLSAFASRWIRGDSSGSKEQTSVETHFSDWLKSGPVRLVQGILSAIRMPLEEVLPSVRAEVTTVHPFHDLLSTEPWVRSLAVDEEHYRSIPDAPHSWPIGDDDRLRTFVAELLA